MGEQTAGEVTQVLRQLSAGRGEGFDEIFPLIYRELRRQAARSLRRERNNHSLQPTALVHEAFLRLQEQRSVRWQNRSHFLAVAAQAMRRVLIDHARARRRLKRGGENSHVTLCEGIAAEESRSVDVLALDQALERLSTVDPRQGRIVELRYFAGLSVEETAEVLKLSPATVKREWAMAKAWLHAELTGSEPDRG